MTKKKIVAISGGAGRIGTAFSKAIVKNMISDNKIFKLDDVSNVGVLVEKAKGEKCSRCWKILGNPCERCSEALKNFM